MKRHRENPLKSPLAHGSLGSVSGQGRGKGCGNVYRGRTIRQGHLTGRGAFTLLELLMVIAVIGIVASLLVGLAPAASVRMKESMTRTELQRLVTAIEAYKAKYGVYPPDNIQGYFQGFPIVNAVTNALYYELSGVYVVNPRGNGHFVPVASAPEPNGQPKILMPDTLPRFFGMGRDGFVNAATEEEQRRLFRLPIKTKQFERLTLEGDVPIELLIAPVPWPANKPAFPPPIQIPGRETMNPWRYVSTNPTNNPGHFDLWCEVVLNNERRVIGNWRN